MVIEKGFTYKTSTYGYSLDPFGEGYLIPYCGTRSGEKVVVIESGETAKNTYQEFIKINLSNTTEILNFYNNYGPLKNETSYPHHESVKMFKYEVNKMQAVILLKQALDENSYDDIMQNAKKLISIYNAGNKNSKELLADYNAHGELICVIDEKSNSREIDMRYLAKLINEDICEEQIREFEKDGRGVSTLCSLLLNDVINEQLESIQPFLIFDLENHSNTGQWRVKTLLSAMYFELFLKFSQNKKIRKCQNQTCPRYFEIIGNDLRKIYCSVECAQLEAKRKQRNRKKESE